MANAKIYAKSKNARNEPSMFGSGMGKRETSNIVSSSNKAQFSAKKDPFTGGSTSTKKAKKKVY